MQPPRVPAPSTDQLVDRVIHGDREALATLFEMYRDRLRKIISFRIDPRLAGRIDPEDVLQEVYLNAQSRLAHVLRETTDGLFVWFRLLVNQTLIDVHRRHLGTKGRDATRIPIRPRSPSPRFCSGI
jgi:RNA polymerase sigma-70 factor, ECF subfamily